MKNSKQIKKTVSAFMLEHYATLAKEMAEVGYPMDLAADVERAVLIVEGSVLISMENELPLDYYDNPASIDRFTDALAAKHPELLVEIKNPGALVVSNA